MRRRTLLLFSVIFLFACREESRSAPEPSATEAPSAPSTSSQAPPASPPSVSSEETVRTIVRDFGGKLQLVSLLAPPDVIASSMREHYAPFVAPALLQKWIDHPTEAPGRKVSSPWPDRIEIGSLKPEGSKQYVVDGEIVEITSDQKVVQKTPVRLVVEENSGAWLITDVSTTAGDGAASTEAGAKEAVAVLEAYYAAINRRDYERAHRYWSGEGSASGQSLEQFRKGFADTAAVEIQIGTPGRIDPAAGSRYIEIPIEITATTIAGKTQHFRGNYVLRRSVVDGATAEQRQWRINSAKIARFTS